MSDARLGMEVMQSFHELTKDGPRQSEWKSFPRLRVLRIRNGDLILHHRASHGHRPGDPHASSSPPLLPLLLLPLLPLLAINASTIEEIEQVASFAQGHEDVGEIIGRGGGDELNDMRVRGKLTPKVNLAGEKSLNEGGRFSVRSGGGRVEKR